MVLINLSNEVYRVISFVRRLTSWLTWSTLINSTLSIAASYEQLLTSLHSLHHCLHLAWDYARHSSPTWQYDSVKGDENLNRRSIRNLRNGTINDFNNWTAEVDRNARKNRPTLKILPSLSLKHFEEVIKRVAKAHAVRIVSFLKLFCASDNMIRNLLENNKSSNSDGHFISVIIHLERKMWHCTIW